ncbi:hypothetical protein J6590_026203 [Homalodisca vitripennis]|nr:hypothetical protein J6590_026203 [Homalodisca vitripennis]
MFGSPLSAVTPVTGCEWINSFVTSLKGWLATAHSTRTSTRPSPCDSSDQCSVTTRECPV